jgi:hypothetical protein
MNEKSNKINIYNTNSLSGYKKRLKKTHNIRKKFLRSIGRSHSLGLVSNIYQQQWGNSLKTLQGGSVGSRR